MLALTVHEVELMVSLEVIVLPSLALLFMLMIYAIVRPHLWRTRQVSHRMNVNIDKCESEHCFRYGCTAYKEVINRAKKLFSQFDQEQTEELTERMKSSLDKLSTEYVYLDSDLQQPNIFFMDGLTAEPWWSADHFGFDSDILEQSYSDILEEFDNSYQNLWPEGWILNTTPTGEWAVFHLYTQGQIVKKNCERCPKTHAAILRLKDAMKENAFGNVSFSVVQPGTHISPHHGPTNTRIRCHLGLRVPAPTSQSALTVNGETRGWTECHTIFFDDSFVHEVYHQPQRDDARAILLVDLWHPSIDERERKIINKLFKTVLTRTLTNVNRS